jgi:uncharacterized membrane protein
MDKVIDKIVALGIPGLVLLIAVSTSGLAGGAAIVAALATLGGPLGMVGGIFLLGLLVLISNGLARYGFEKIFVGVINGLKKKGISKKEIKEKVEKYPISKELKQKLINLL